MPLILDEIALSPDEARAVQRSDAKVWFGHVKFANAESPRHPGFQYLDVHDGFKQSYIEQWFARLAPDARVLDTFCANGTFSIQAARLGAREVVGVEFDSGRVECARFLAGVLKNHGWRVTPQFVVGDVYKLGDVVAGPFDLTLCLGGLYHVADPAFVLKRLREATREGGHLILQTANVLPWPGSWGRFWAVEEDKVSQGCTSLRGGAGRWRLTRSAVDALCRHAGFEVIEHRSPSPRAWRQFPYYFVLGQAV